VPAAGSNASAEIIAEVRRSRLSLVICRAPPNSRGPHIPRWSGDDRLGTAGTATAITDRAAGRELRSVAWVRVGAPRNAHRPDALPLANP
jgi:hypothetical protein